MFSTSVLVGSLFFAAHVSGLAARSPLALLVARQSTNPLGIDTSDKCQPECAAIAIALSGPTAALCTNANGAALENCVRCIQSISPSPTTTQVILDQFEQGCAAAGTPVTLGGSGGSGGGGLTSHSPSATVSASKGATSPSSSSTRTATTGLGTSPSASGTAGSDGSVNQLNNSNAAGRATVGSVGLIGLAMGAAVLLL